MGELRDTIRTTEAELAEIEKDIVHLKHEYEAAQKELAQCRHEISVIDVEVSIMLVPYPTTKANFRLMDYVYVMFLMMKKIYPMRIFPPIFSKKFQYKNMIVLILMFIQ